MEKKEKIWMGKEIELNIKLHNLFKEYIENYGGDAKSADSLDYVVIDDWQAFLYWQRTYLYETLISKKFGMVEWLVENDKIDFENMEWHWRLIWYLTDNMEKPTRDKVKEDVVIMLLSISDTPIEDLISYLK